MYALRRPDPVPAVFGYHEVFHLLVIAGVSAHFLASSTWSSAAATGGSCGSASADTPSRRGTSIPSG